MALAVNGSKDITTSKVQLRIGYLLLALGASIRLFKQKFGMKFSPDLRGVREFAERVLNLSNGRTRFANRA